MKKPDEIERFIEWQEHQYDPGHWVGKWHPHPLLQGKRPNKMGYVLLLWGLLGLVLTVVLTVGCISEGIPEGGPLVIVGIVFGIALFFLASALYITVGIVLLTPQRKRKDRRKKREKP